jgi:tRNA G18 (ribose-2'-O)-methylase SpoU
VTVHRVRDPVDPLAAPFRDIPTYDRRAESDTFIVESRQCVRRLVESRFRVRAVCATPSALAALEPLLAAAAPTATLLEAEEPVMKTITGFPFHRGCLAIGERGTPLGVDDVVGHLGDGPATLVVLDAVSDPDNVGAIFRNALAFGAAGILLSPTAGDPLYRKATRVSVGATLHLPFARSEDFAADLARLGAAGFALPALTPDGEPLEPTPVPPQRALLVGAEGDGLGAVARAAADRAIRIPMAPGSDSLNVATASGIALYELARGAV